MNHYLGLIHRQISDKQSNNVFCDLAHKKLKTTLDNLSKGYIQNVQKDKKK